MNMWLVYTCRIFLYGNSNVNRYFHLFIYIDIFGQTMWNIYIICDIEIEIL